MYNKNFFKNITLIDSAVDKDIIDDAVVNLIKQKVYENYFFGKISSEKWFYVLKAIGYFKPQNNPSPILDKERRGYKIPEWNILRYLEVLSSTTRDFDKELLKIIEAASLYKKKGGKHVDNYRTWWYFVKILINIPLSEVPYEIFSEAIPIWLTSKFDLSLSGTDLVTKLLPSYLKQAENSEEIKKVEKLIDLSLETKIIKLKAKSLGKTEEIKTKIDKYWLEDSFLKADTVTLIAQKCSATPIFNLATNINNIFKKRKLKKQDYSSIWLSDLTLEQKESLNDGEYFLALILKKLSVEKAKANPTEGKIIIKNFLSTKYAYYLFRRIAILMIAESWNNYDRQFDTILDDPKEAYFSIEAYYPELSYLLKINAKALSLKQKSKLKKIFHNGPQKELPDNSREEYTLFWKQRWYKTLIDLPEFRKLHDEIKSKTKKEISEERTEESEFINFDKSPVSVDDLLKKSNTEIIKYISDYKPKGDFPDFSPEGVQRKFQEAVKANPDKFTSDLEPFRATLPYTLSSLFSGLKEAWEENKNIDWKKTLQFIVTLIEKEDFWQKRLSQQRGNYNYLDWALSSIAYLLQTGSKSDEHAFPEKLHGKVEAIIAIYIESLDRQKEKSQGDTVTSALNSTWGKILTCLIYLGLREARLSDKKNEKKISKWSGSLKNSYEQALKENVVEAYILLGEYLPNLHYVDKAWAENQAKNIHLLKDDNLFEAFMDGYLFSGKVYDSLYKLLDKSYERALVIDFKEKRMEERLIQHIAVGYLRGNEEIGKESLIDKLFSSSDPQNIKKVIEFTWHQKDFILDETQFTDKKAEEEKVKFREKIFALWQYIIEFYKRKRVITDEEEKTLSELNKLAVYVSELNEDFYKRLSFSAPYATIDYDSPFFIEYLNSIKEKGEKKQTAKYIGKLFLKMLKGAKDIFPDYKWENIEEIVKFLYAANDKSVKELANQICILYGVNGNLKLRNLYEEYNKVK